MEHSEPGKQDLRTVKVDILNDVEYLNADPEVMKYKCNEVSHLSTKVANSDHIQRDRVIDKVSKLSPMAEVISTVSTKSSYAIDGIPQNTEIRSSPKKPKQRIKDIALALFEKHERAEDLKNEYAKYRINRGKTAHQSRLESN